jgi:hypothetical protein
MKLKAAIIGHTYWGPKLASNFINTTKFQINYDINDKQGNLIKSKKEIPLSIVFSDFQMIKKQITNLIFFNISK